MKKLLKEAQRLLTGLITKCSFETVYDVFVLTTFREITSASVRLILRNAIVLMLVCRCNLHVAKTKFKDFNIERPQHSLKTRVIKTFAVSIPQTCK